MEERRLEGRRLGQQRIAEELGVSRYTATRWAKELKGGGVEALLSRKASGRPPRLSQEGAALLLQALRQGAKAHGYADARWTLVRIAEVLQKGSAPPPHDSHPFEIVAVKEELETSEVHGVGPREGAGAPDEPSEPLTGMGMPARR